MTTWISMLRGINVSGKNMIKMDALRRLYLDLGFEAVQTYIQSGNVVFRSADDGPAALAVRIAAAIREAYGYDVPVLVLSADELGHIVAHNPFVNERREDPAFLHVTFLGQTPDPDVFDALSETPAGADECILRDRAVYLFCPGGYGNTKLSNTFFEKKLKVPATTRNWKTTCELLSIARTLS